VHFNVAPSGDFVLGPTYARFRLDSKSGLSFDGIGQNGEMEDYRVEIQPIAAAFDPAASSLQVTGSSAADHVEVRADVSGRIRVFSTLGNRVEIPILDAAAGMPLDPTSNAWPTTANTKVVGIDGRKGNDVISVQIVNPGTLVGFNPQPEPPLVHLNIDAGAGDDTIDARMTIGPTPFVPSRTVVNINGGLGNDVISARIVNPGTLAGFNPQPEPPLVRLTIDGGAGRDVVDAVFSGELSEVRAKLDVRLFGGADNDLLTLLWDDEIWDVLAFVDGGTGSDTGVFSPGTRHTRIERVRFG
jgi:hypothetical protein